MATRYKNLYHHAKQDLLAMSDQLHELHKPIAMRLTCPACGELHVDGGDFAVKPHHTHACQRCGMVWRPAIRPTVGVRFLPGCRDSVDGVMTISEARES